MKDLELEELLTIQPAELAIRKKLFIYYKGISEEILRLELIEKDLLSYYFLIGMKYSTRYWFLAINSSPTIIQEFYKEEYGSEEKLLIKRTPLLEQTLSALNSINDIREYQNRGLDTNKDVIELIAFEKEYLLTIYKMLEYEFPSGTFFPKIDYLGEFKEWKKDVALNGLAGRLL